MPTYEIADIDLPEELKLDECTHRTLEFAVAGNTFCGLMAVPSGFIYLVPYTGGQASKPYPKTPQVAGIPIQPINHQAGGIPGHEQLATFLATKAMIKNQTFVGFSLLFAPEKGGFGDTSRSQNNQHFRKWQFGNQETAFSKYWETERLNTEKDKPVKKGAPRFFDVTAPADGSLPEEWKIKMINLLVQKLGKAWTDTTIASVAIVVSDAPLAPPMGNTTFQQSAGLYTGNVVKPK